MRNLINTLAIALAMLSAPAAGRSQAAEVVRDVPGITKYARINRSDWDKASARFETSIVTFRSTIDPEVEVTLVGVVHVGEAQYYERINDVLGGFETVLYEWIGPRNSVPVKGVHGELAFALRLESQTSRIRYDRPGFVHADMTEEEFVPAMTKAPPLVGGTPIHVLLRRPDYRRNRWEMGRELHRDTVLLKHPVIIGQRNKVALDVLERQIGSGKRRIAIFYGAAHMPDFEQHLISRFGMTAVRTDWVKAWDME